MAFTYTIGTPVQFEPNPTGPAGSRPSNLSSGYQSHVEIYDIFLQGQYRLLMQEAWGYSVLSLANPLVPSVTRWDDLRNASPSMPQAGDGQSYIQTIAVSRDGVKAAFSVSGPAEANFGTALATGYAQDLFVLNGDVGNSRASGTAVHTKGLPGHVDTRYICYNVFTTAGLVTATDIAQELPPIHNTWPAKGCYDDQSEVVAWPAPTDSPCLRVYGDFLVYVTLNNDIFVGNVSNPGAIGSITAGMPTKIILKTLPIFDSTKPLYICDGQVDSTGNKLWLLIYSSTNQTNAGYSLLYVTKDPGTGIISEPVVVGTRFVLPSGEASPGPCSSLIYKNNTLHSLLLSQQLSPSYKIRMYTMSDENWGVPVSTVVLTDMVPMIGFNDHIPKLDYGGTTYLYPTSGGAAYVIPVSITGGGSVVTAPSNVVASNITATSAVINATAPTSIGTGFGHYNVYVNNVSRINSVAPYFPFTLSGLSSSTNYTVEVSFTDSSGTEGPKSSSVTFTTQSSGPSPIPPTAPQNVVVAVGAATDSVKVTWEPPVTTNGTLINYTITNKVTSVVQTLSASTSPLTVTFTGLTYGVAYTFGVIVNNSAGNSPETVSADITLIAPPSVPSEPNNVVVTVTPAGVTVTWEAPTSNGGSPLTYYAVNLYDTTSGTAYEPKTTVTASVLSYTITGLIAGHSYYFTIKATNSSSDPKIYGPPEVSISFDPDTTVSGKILVKNSFNYVKFYEAPVILDPESPNYEEFLYPETITQSVFSLISNSELTLPITFPQTLNAIAISYQVPTDAFPTPYYIPLNEIVYTDLYSLIEELQYKVDSGFYPFEVLSISDEVSGKNTIIFQAKYVTKLFTLTSEDPVIAGTTYTNANDIIFGTTPNIFEGYEEPLVENHIPTAEYDNLHYKALVESMVILSRKNLPVAYKLSSEPKTYPYMEDDGDIVTYKLTVDNVPLRPKKVDVFWYNDTNQYTHLVDYRGDGILLEKIKTIDEFGNITYTYEPNTETGYGVVDYAQGTISQLKVKNYRHASILGVGGTFPLTVGASAFLSLNVRGLIANITIASGVYTAQSLVSYLNQLFEFTSYQLTAGYQNGQVFVVNNLAGPNQTLSTVGAEFGSLTIPIFGFKPIETPPPPVYISYSYSLNQVNKNQYIWYQTPHFLIRVNNQADSSLFTTAHLNYILNKTAQLKPITTVLNSINLNSTLTEEVAVSDSLEVLVYPKDPLVDPPLTYPYIIVDIMTPLGYGIPDFPMIDPYDITVTNPDDQSDTAVAAWTYIL